MSAEIAGTMSGQTLSVEQQGRVLTVRIDHPPRNFIGQELIADLDQLTRALKRDRSVGAVVLTAKPDDIFVPHAAPVDLGPYGTAAPAGTHRQVRGAGGVVAALRRVPGVGRALRRTPL